MDRMLTGRDAAEVLTKGLGRRGFLGAAAGIGALAVTTGCTIRPASSTPTAAQAGSVGSPGAQPGEILQPHTGDIPGDHYLVSTPDEVLWGYVPTVHASPVARMKSGQTITIDALSHEGILEDQGRDPVSFFGGHGVEESGVLQDAVEIAAHYNRTPRNFDTDGPHVVTGPVAVEGAEPGDVLKIETLDAVPRVPYGVVSSRHGKGSLAVQPGPAAPAGITLEEVMPPVDTDSRGSGIPTDYHNVSVFTAVEDGKGMMTSGDMKVRFPLRPFMGMMGVAFAETSGLTDPEANSVPPTLGGATSISATWVRGPPSICRSRPTAPCSTWATRTWVWATAKSH